MFLLRVISIEPQKRKVRRRQPGAHQGALQACSAEARSRRRFTLVELLIAMAVMMTIVAIAIPNNLWLPGCGISSAVRLKM